MFLSFFLPLWQGPSNEVPKEWFIEMNKERKRSEGKMFREKEREKEVKEVRKKLERIALQCVDDSALKCVGLVCKVIAVSLPPSLHFFFHSLLIFSFFPSFSSSPFLCFWFSLFWLKYNLSTEIVWQNYFIFIFLSLTQSLIQVCFISSSSSWFLFHLFITEFWSEKEKEE